MNQLHKDTAKDLICWNDKWSIIIGAPLVTFMIPFVFFWNSFYKSTSTNTPNLFNYPYHHLNNLARESENHDLGQNQIQWPRKIKKEIDYSIHFNADLYTG